MKFQGFGLCGTGELVEEYEPLICNEMRREIGRQFSKLEQKKIDELINGAEAALRTALMFKNEDERSIKDAIN